MSKQLLECVGYIHDHVFKYLELLQFDLAREQLGLRELFQREDALLLFRAHMALLEGSIKDEEKPSTDSINEKNQAEVQSLIALGQRLVTLGASPLLLLRYSRLISEVLCQTIRSLVISEKSTTELLMKTQHQSRLIDTVLIDFCEDTIKSQSVASLESANLKLLREKSLYKNVFFGTSNLVMVTDGQGKVVESNPEANSFFANHEVVGSFCSSLLGLPGTGLSELLVKYPPNQPHEISFTRSPDGIKRYFNLQIKPLDKSLDASHGIIMILNDITCMVDYRQLLEERIFKRTAALSRSEKLLGAIFDAVGKGIILIDSDEGIVKVNQRASEIYGRPADVLTGDHLSSLIDQDGCALLKRARNEIVDGQQFKAEVDSLYVDGSTFPCVVTMTRINLEAQPYWTLIVRDVTDQKLMERKLREEKQHAEEMNVTLRNVLKSIEDDRKLFEEKLTGRIRSSILPGIDRIRAEGSDEARQGYLTLLKNQMISMTTGFEVELDGDLLKLTKRELEICQLIKAGLSGKEVCESLNLSFETIQTHRKNIRKKLGLKGQDHSLYQFLASKNCDH